MTQEAALSVARSPTIFQGQADKRWNTKHLSYRIGTDATSAATASALIAPIICVIDQAIVRKAASTAALSTCLWTSLTPALLRPHHFVLSRPFLLIFSLYTSTYFTANTIDTATSTIYNRPVNEVSSGPTKFAATSAVNMSMCVYKDSQFARLFGNSSAPAAKIPKISYALFACRDSMTIFASFNLPSIIAPRLAELPTPVKQKFSRILSTESGRTNTAQFIAPAAMQIFSTPIHLLGLDLYNRQGQLGFQQRSLMITRNWLVCAFARMGRIIPAFGVGGVVNANVRSSLLASSTAEMS